MMVIAAWIIACLPLTGLPQDSDIPQDAEIAQEEENPQSEESLEEEDLPQQTDIPQHAEVTRFSDRVTYIQGRTGQETVLFYNNKTVLLEEGDEVRQGSSGMTEVRLEDDGQIRFFSRARYRLGQLSLDVHFIRVDDFTRILLQAAESVVLLLPGGTRLETAYTESYIEKDGNLIRIRNAGPNEILLSGYLVTEEDEEVPPGNTCSIPLFDSGLKEEMEPIVVREVDGMIVKTTGGYSFEEKPGCIIVSRPSADDGIACIGGARIFLEPGKSLKLEMD